jgi:hypothetical protein
MHKVLLGLAGAVVLGFGIILLLQGTKSARLVLNGSVLKVRTMAAGDGGTLVVADFRLTNPSTTPFVVEDVEFILEPKTGDKVTGRMIAKSQMDLIFRSKMLIGAKYNDILGMKDRIPPGQTLDRTAAARFEVPSGAIDARKSLKLRFSEIDGEVSEITDSGLR